MDELEDRLGTILKDPEAMQKIMDFAQKFNRPDSDPKQPSGEISSPALMQKLSGITKAGSIDKNQQVLLKALSPYLSRQRLQKLEKAMRAAKIAGMAGNFPGR